MKKYLSFLVGIALLLTTCRKEEANRLENPNLKNHPSFNGFIDFDISKVYNWNGHRPLEEYSDKCQGVQGIWNMSALNNREVVGLLTSDSKITIVAMLGYEGGAWGGLYPYNGEVYYTYPASEGAPSQSYASLVESANQYFIKVVATIHTHNPCIQNGGDGVKDIVQLSSGDQNLSRDFQNMNHYIIGCEALGKFIYPQSTPILLQSGSLSNTCNQIQ